VVLLAAKSGAPVVPVAHFGGERFWANIKALRKTRVRIRVGATLHIDPSRARNRRAREETLEEIMRSLSGLLPEWYRGHYA
jgi:1-acyl-sn-glycerol-3-phosphate acyltransferase